MRIAGAFRRSDTMVSVMRAEDGSFVDVNPAFEAALGWRIEEVVGRRPLELGIWADLGTRSGLLMRLQAGESIAGHPARLRRRDGTTFPALLDVELLDHEGGLYVLCMGRPATEEAGACAPGEDSGNYHELYLAAAEGLYRSLPERGFIDVNPAMARILGYESAEQLLREAPPSAHDFYVDASQSRRLYEQLLRDGHIDQVRSQVYRRDGSIIWISENARVVRDEHGRPLFYEGSVVDITAEVAAEAALRQSEALYRILVDNCRDGVFLIQRGTIVFANEALASMLGYRSEELFGTEYMALVAPEDRPAQLQRRMQRESGSQAVQQYEVNLLRKDGSAALFSVHADAVEFEGDIASAGVMRDVTEERRQRLALEEAERRYRELFEESPVGLFRTRRDGGVLQVNPAMARLLGFDSPAQLKQELASMNAIYVRPGDRDALVERVLRDGTIADQELQVLAKDGRRLWVRVNVRVLPGGDERERHFAGSMQDISAHREAEQRLKFHATHDPLTGLPNRLLFQQRLGEALRTARATNDHSYAVLFLDLDGFKLVNDSLGHAAGDRLLVTLAEKLAHSLEGEALVARYGGDEFTILPTMPCGRERAEALADRILRLFGAPFDIGGQQVFSGSSVGIVLGRPEYRSADQVLRDADTAMYRAKALGKSAHVVFDEAMHRAARERFQLETDVRLAFERREFRVHYQPIVDLASGAVRGCEALVRWQHPDRGLLLPSEFLPAAEESGLIAALDWWVMEEACRQMALWHARHPAYAGLRLNVNMDERQLASRNLVPSVQAVLDQTGIDPRRLMLEVTETVFRAGREGAAAMLQRLKGLGVGLVVDDFGTGYSSLDSFASSPFDALKIDHNFIRDVESNPRHRAIVRTIIRFAEDLGLALTAEGVETQQQRRLLMELRCGEGQGFLFARAMPADQFESLLRGASLPLAAGA